MRSEFAHYWQEGVILNEEEREHQRKIMQAMIKALCTQFQMARL